MEKGRGEGSVLWKVSREGCNQLDGFLYMILFEAGRSKESGSKGSEERGSREREGK